MVKQDAHLIVGLGNPGERYVNTWHNIGAEVVDKLALRWQIKLKPDKNKCILADGFYNDEKCYLLIPTTYMNRSGEAVSSFIRYHNLQPVNLIVIYDDHDLPLGKIRLRDIGTSGGHRGIEDVITRLNSDNFRRLKIGVRVQAEKRDLSHQILTKISSLYRTDVDIVIETAADAVEMTIADGFMPAMNRYNGLDIFT